MEIQSLRFLLTEADLNRWASSAVTHASKLRGLRVRLLSEGISVAGSYQTVIDVSFETLWEVFIHRGKIAARLQTLKTGGFGVSLARRYVLEAIASRTNRIKVEGDMLLFDLDLLLEEQGIAVRTNLKSVHCSHGSVVIESRSGEF
jgi:hypothetical protein